MNCKPRVNSSGTVMWEDEQGRLNRADNLLTVLSNKGSIYYHKDDALHREGGLPAIIHYDGSKEYWLNGYRYPKL